MNTKPSRGFTIVELLIVVVIIAILAAITIVAYNGIQARAKTSAAQSMANSAIKKIEAYNVDDTSPTAGYPSAATQLTSAASGAVYRLDGVTWGTPASTANTNVLRYTACGHNGTATAPATVAAMTSIVGGKIEYYNYSTPGIVTVNAGNTTTGGTPNIACIVANS